MKSRIFYIIRIALCERYCSLLAPVLLLCFPNEGWCQKTNSADRSIQSVMEELGSINAKRCPFETIYAANCEFIYTGSSDSIVVRLHESTYDSVDATKRHRVIWKTYIFNQRKELVRLVRYDSFTSTATNEKSKVMLTLYAFSLPTHGNSFSSRKKQVAFSRSIVDLSKGSEGVSFGPLVNGLYEYCPAPKSDRQYHIPIHF